MNDELGFRMSKRSTVNYEEVDRERILRSIKKEGSEVKERRQKEWEQI